ncbi:MAG: flagellar filament capping protein FliD [Butyrivibrio sp.]|nr:flagellar filament capping protein FliD [Butyrivibrio sp.]
MGSTISSIENSFSLADYAAIKNGSYKKLLKSYYQQEEEEKAASAPGDSKNKLTSIKASADELKNTVEALQKEDLWKTKKFTKIDEETGKETEVEDYDWEAITNAVKNFTEAYNNVIGAAGDSDTKGILMNASWLTKMTASNGRTLAKAGITIGKDNKLSVDEDALKESISTVKLLFKGYNSFADKASSKAEGISNSAAREASNKAAAYDKHGAYTNPLAPSVKNQVDSALGSGKSESGNTSKTTANTDKVDREIKDLKSRRDSLKQKLKNEYDTEKRREYEKELKQVENELAVKDSDSYRKQNAQYVTL